MIWFSYVNKLKESKDNMPDFVRSIVTKNIACFLRKKKIKNKKSNQHNQNKQNNESKNS